MAHSMSPGMIQQNISRCVQLHGSVTNTLKQVSSTGPELEDAIYI